MIRTVATGDIGLDVLLGGGWRLVERLPGLESATVVVRGGPGTGKTLLSLDVAVALAGALHGDVVVGCVELLPTEYVAQIESGRGQLTLQWRDGPPSPESRVFVLPSQDHLEPSMAPRILCGLLADLEPEAPDLVSALEILQREVQKIHGKPAVFIVDSLIGGYGLGPYTPRRNVDALMKFAADAGVGLVMCEETVDDTPSPWDFSADTVLELEHHRVAGRQILVRKHRYGPSEHGAHEFEILGWRQPRVSPRPGSWSRGNRIAPTLSRHGWRFVEGRTRSPLMWIKEIAPIGSSHQAYESAFTVVSGPNLEVARRLAFGLVPMGADSRRDVVIELVPFGSEPDGLFFGPASVRFVPTVTGASVAVCDLVEYLGTVLFQHDGDQRPRRIVIGDVSSVSSDPDRAAWVEGIRALAALVDDSGWGVPVIAYDGASGGRSSLGGAALRRHGELVVDARYSLHKTVTAEVISRRHGTVETLQWPSLALEGLWPGEIRHLAQLPHSPRRHFVRLAGPNDPTG